MEIQHARSRPKVHRKLLRISAQKQFTNSTKSPHLVIGDHRKQVGTIGEVAATDPQIVFLIACILHVLDVSEVLWTVSYLARSGRKWNRACEKRLASLMRDIHHTAKYEIVWSFSRKRR